MRGILEPVRPPERIAPPTSSVATVAELRDQARIDATDEDTLLTRKIAEATAFLDGFDGALGACLLTQRWRQSFRCFSHRMLLPLGPVQSIEAVRYFDADEAEQTLDSGAYRLQRSHLGHYVEIASTASLPGVYDRDDAVSIEYRAGRGDSAADLPADLVGAVLSLATHLYEHRSVGVVGTIYTKIPFSVSSVIDRYKQW